MRKNKAAVSKAEADRLHVERMLARARRKAKQAEKLVGKWEARLAEASRKEVALKQGVLWEQTSESMAI